MAEVEEQARSQGWVPEEEWSGDPKSWVPADEFVRRGSLFARIKTQSKEIGELRKAIQDLGAHNARLEEHRLKEQESELKKARRNAIENMDYEAVEKADEALQEVSSAKNELSQRLESLNIQEPVPNAIVALKEYANDNPWYMSDPIAQAAFNAVCDSLIGQHADGYELIEAADKIYKERFNPKTPTEDNKREKAPAVDTSLDNAPPTSSKRGKKFTVKDLTAEQRRAAERMVDMGVFQDKEGKLTRDQRLQKYVDQMVETGAFENDRS